MERVDGGSCAGANAVIGVVETWTALSPSPRRAVVRNNIRETWMTLGGPTVEVVFVIGLNVTDDHPWPVLPPAVLAAEADKFGDIVFVPMAKKHPYSLLEKTLAFFKFASSCGAAEGAIVMKTNEHSMVRADIVASLAESGEYSTPGSVVTHLLQTLQSLPPPVSC
jgi:hypothetical protein